MSLVFRKSTIDDVNALLKIQRASFQEDLEKYKDTETNPACETYDKLAENIRSIIIIQYWLMKILSEE